MSQELVSVNIMPSGPDPEEVQIIADKTVTTTFTVPNGTRPEIEECIESRLSSDKALEWKDGPDGVRAACLYKNKVWRPRARFNLDD
jgi:hypothetical protein